MKKVNHEVNGKGKLTTGMSQNPNSIPIILGPVSSGLNLHPLYHLSLCCLVLEQSDEIPCIIVTQIMFISDYQRVVHSIP